MPATRTLASGLFYIGFAACVVTAVASCDSGPTISTANGTDTGNTSGVETEPLDIAAALGSEASLSLTVELDGAQVLPPATTRETARADIVFDRTSSSLFAVLKTPLQATLQKQLEVHIHEGAVGEVGAELASLYDHASGYRVDGVTLTERQVQLLEDGNLYIDVHTDQNPHGLLRGQLREEPVEVTIQPSLDDIQAKVLTPVCSGCHNGKGQTLPGIMDFTHADHSYESLIGVYSINEPMLLRVDPGNAQDSFLFRKIEGTHTVGSRMPFRGSQLSEQALIAIQTWIANGAVR